MSAPQLPAGLQPGGRFAQWQPSTVDYVVCDVDGTLLGPTSDPTPAVVAAVAAAVRAGLRVGYATGRMRDGVRHLHDQLGATGPHVFHNGAEVRLDGRTLTAWSLDAEQIDVLLGLAGGHEDLYLEVYGESGFHVSAWDERASLHWNLLGSRPLGLVSTAAELPAGPVPKATFAVFTAEAGRWLDGKLASMDVEVGTAGSPLTPGMAFTNVNQPGATKGGAIRAAAEHLALPLSRVAAIGDADNDLSMLEIVGTAIAMGQAEPHVQEAAHLVAPTVDDDGAATALAALSATMAGPAGTTP